MLQRRHIIGGLLILGFLSSPARAQVPVTDVATTVRNALTAVTKELLVKLQEDQHSELKRMAARLSLFTDLSKYATRDVPLWRIHDFENVETYLFSRGYHAALNYGDASGREYLDIARSRLPYADALQKLAPNERNAVLRMLATLDVADSALVTGTHQTGQLRYNGRRELQAITALEAHVIDGSQTQSATAVADKISGAILIAARQRQARNQLLAALLEELLVDNKRARDADVVAMNMQLDRVLNGHSNNAVFAGSAEALRAWRQP